MKSWHVVWFPFWLSITHVLAGHQGVDIRNYILEALQSAAGTSFVFTFPEVAGATVAVLVPIWCFVYQKPDGDFPYIHNFRSYLPGLLGGGYDGLREPVEVRRGSNDSLAEVTKGRACGREHADLILDYVEQQSDVTGHQDRCASA